MTDYLDIMSICSFDVAKSTKVVEEMLRECGLERNEEEDYYVHSLQPQPSAK